jgi:tetratricopeptide (TPR) repeat protein
LSDSTQNQLREALAETTRRQSASAKPVKLARVRISAGGYLAVAAFLTFASLVCLRTNRDLLALTLIVGTWTIIPVLILTDRISFDGKRLWRTGPFAWFSRLVRGRREGLSVEDIERVEIATLRTLRRGGNVRYRFRIEINGKGLSFAFSSGGKEFRRMAQTLLPQIPDYKLDACACELRDHLKDTKTVRAEAARLGIAPTAVLDEAREAGRRQRSATPPHQPSVEEVERAQSLRQSANDLRIAGCLRQSGEAFRRALHISGGHPWLVYEYARLLRAQASAFSDARLLGRACAALKLASLRGPSDARLLERVGESFLEFGDPTRAAKIFRRALDANDTACRAQLGLAEVALGEGKLAHVIHHYDEAVRCAPDKALARLARRESEYYGRLNDDEDYLAAELRRMNWLDGAGRIQQLAGRVSFASLLIALIGPSVDQVVAGLGWALASSSIIAWTGSLITRKVLAARSRSEMRDA